MGQSPPSFTYNKNGIGLPFLQGKTEFGDIYPSPNTYCSNPIKVAEANDILISVRAPVGDVNLAPYKLCIGRGLAAIRCSNKTANYLFYFYYLQKIKPFLEALGKGSTFKAIVKNDLESLKIPLPSFEEQKRIAYVLFVVDEAIRKTDEIITKTERLKKGLMRELLTKGIGHKEFKETEIGRIPKEWKVIRLEDVLILKNGERPQLSEMGTIPVYGANGIMGYTEKYLVDNDFTIIIGRVGASGEVHLGAGKIWVSDNAIYSDKYNSNYVHLPFTYYLLKYKQLSRFATKTTHPIITQSFLKSYKVQLPPLHEQQKIADILLTVDKRLEVARKKKEKLERIKKALMDLLLTGKVRVKVD